MCPFGYDALPRVRPAAPALRPAGEPHGAGGVVEWVVGHEAVRSVRQPRCPVAGSTGPLVRVTRPVTGRSHVTGSSRRIRGPPPHHPRPSEIPRSRPVPATIVDLGRRRHYGAFYGLDPVPTGRPLLLLLGNCQAESLRLLLDPAAAEPLDQPAGPAPTGPPTDPPADTRGAHSTDPGGAPSAVLRGTHPTRPTSDVVSVRVPPIHELTADDLPHLDALLERADLLVAQPTRADYRGLPLGTEQVLARPAPTCARPWCRACGTPGCTPSTSSSTRPSSTGWCPRSWPTTTCAPSCWPRAATPTPAPTAAASTTCSTTSPRSPPTPCGRSATTRAPSCAAASSNTAAVAVADLLDDPAVDDMRTVNHPGPRVLTGVARRVRASLGLAPLEVDPGRPLLDDVHAPVHPAVAAVRRPADGPAPSPDHWRVGGRSVAEREVLAAQLAWYADHPAMVREALARHGRTLDHLGLAP